MPENRIITTLRSPEHPLFKHLFYLTWLKNIRDYVLTEEIIQLQLVQFLEADKQKQLALLIQSEQEYLRQQTEFNAIFFEKSSAQYKTHETALTSTTLPVFTEILASISQLNQQIDSIGQLMAVTMNADTHRFAQALAAHEFKVQLDSFDSIDSKTMASALLGIPTPPALPQILRVVHPDENQPIHLDQVTHAGKHGGVMQQFSEIMAITRAHYGDQMAASHIVKMVKALMHHNGFLDLYNSSHEPTKRNEMMGSLITLYEERNAALGLLNQVQSKLDEVSDQYASPFSTNPFSTKPIKK